MALRTHPQMQFDSDRRLAEINFTKMNDLLELHARALPQPSEAPGDFIVADPNGLKSDLSLAATSSSEQSSQRTIGSSGGSERPLASVSKLDPVSDDIFGSVKLLAPWFPNVDPHKHTFRTRRSRRSVVIWTAFAATLSIFLINILSTIWVWARYSLSSDGVATLYEGDCSIAKRLDAGLHVLINVLSTVLLSFSNLSLQLLLSPERTEIDKAHRNGQWLDIGVPSLRNIKVLDRMTVAVATLIVLSALPIHFLYNATIFSAVSSNSFLFAIVTEAFLHPATVDMTFVLGNGTAVAAPTGINMTILPSAHGNLPFLNVHQEESAEIQKTLHAIHRDVQVNLQNYRQLSSYACLSLYDNPYTVRPNVLLVSNDYATALKFNTSLLAVNTQRSSGSNSGGLDPMIWNKDWAKSWHDIPNLDESIMDGWRDVGYRIQYCLQAPDASAAKASSACRVQCAPSVLLFTSIFNLFKCLGVLWLYYKRRQDTICTLGDAIASFLEKPDPITEDFGVATSRSIVDIASHDLKHVKGSSQEWLPEDVRWYNAGSKARWWLTMTLSIMFFASGVVTLVIAWSAVIRYYTLSDLGWGTTTYKELIDWNQPTAGKLGLFANILIANVWQVLLSLCYVAQNAILSCQLVADEWTGFATERKSLRVSHPVGIQRSKYFVSMPLRYGMPIMALFALEHWFLSQTTFVIRVIHFDFSTTPFTASEGWTTAGFSILPALAASILGASMLTAQMANAYFRKYRAASAMPLASICSLAISANCHRPGGDEQAHLLPVQWGVIGKDSEGVQKCSFTTLRTVRAPTKGEQVFGLLDARSSGRSGPWSWVVKTTGTVSENSAALWSSMVKASDTVSKHRYRSVLSSDKMHV